MKNLKKILMGTLMSFMVAVVGETTAYASVSLNVAPMHQKIVLMPGESYEGSFTVSNAASNDEALHYGTSVMPFYLDDSNSVVFEKNDNYNQIVDWITVKNGTGSLAPNSSEIIRYSIDVPENAPAGGQYAMIKVGSVNPDTLSSGNSVNIDITYGVGYLIYAEVTGATERRGEIIEADVPGFIFDGNITASSSIKNTGNVHGIAKYTLQIFPLFSSEEVFTNEEEPATRTIIPEQTIYNETVWDKTPVFGVFNVIYNVEYEGATAQVKKMVIKCPIWLLFIIIFAIVALIIWLVLRAKNRGNKRRAEA